MKHSEDRQSTDGLDPHRIRCVVFDFGFTLSPDFYFKVAPPGYDYRQWHQTIQEHIFTDETITIPWMKGEIGSRDVAAVIGKYIPLDPEILLRTMEKGCENLRLNLAVWDFAVMQKMNGRKTAIVTGNMDIFTKVVTPAHKLDRYFDVVINSADFHEIRKEYLWPRAFERLGGDIGYSDSLLIEDEETEPEKFRRLGGHAYQYTNDKEFSKWYHSFDWSISGYG